MMKKMFATMSSLALVTMLALSVAAQQGTAEKVGKDVGSAAKTTGKAVGKGATTAADATKTVATKTAGAAKGAAKGTKEGLTAKSDPDLQKCVMDKIAASTTLKSLGLNATASNGVVTLTGKVKNSASKATATKFAKACGAKTITNNITIDAPAAHTTTAAKPAVPKPSPTKKPQS